MFPILYSFRRCPYAIRARYCLAILGVRVKLREVVLKAKPNALLSLGGSSTVPQLLTQNGERLPQSLDVIFWSLAQTENHSLAASLWPLQKTAQQKIVSWLNYNDRFFKYWLDRYKYADRHPDFSEQYYRMRGEVFLARLEARLSARAFIMGDQMSLADICLFPFIRQFAAVDSDWFNASKYEKVKGWLSGFLMSESFSEVMKKYPAWEEGQEVVYFPR
ncbi:MAG: glutathione S-transferase [Marinomonas sp.]|uniref:glutathione S-transferase n=1 Tax=Marinomonas sp. TaxID=1904862 RepID=UPI003C7884FF